MEHLQNRAAEKAIREAKKMVGPAKHKTRWHWPPIETITYAVSVYAAILATVLLVAQVRQDNDLLKMKTELKQVKEESSFKRVKELEEQLESYYAEWNTPERAIWKAQKKK